jgi:DNA topoisomerase-1
MQFRFRGKSGVWHAFALEDRKLAAIVRHMRDLPGYELFQYLDESGETRAIDSADVNAYLKEIAGEEFTSKDFRTWAGTVLAAQAFHEMGLTRGIEQVARQLGNTRAVCRKCYIHPAVIEACTDGTLAQVMARGNVERCVQRLLARRKPDSLVPALRRSLQRLRRRGTELAAGDARRLAR